MQFYLARDSPVHFYKDYSNGIFGKYGDVQIDPVFAEHFSDQEKRLANAVVDKLNSHQTYTEMDVRIISKDCHSGHGILQIGDSWKVLQYICELRNVASVTVKAILSHLERKSTGEILSPSRMESSEMRILLDNQENTCQDFEVPFPDTVWYDAFRKRKEQILTKIDIQLTVTFNFSLHQSNSTNMAICEKIFHDENTKDVVIVCQGGKKVSCHKTFITACSPVFAETIETDMMENQTGQLEMLDVSEDLVVAFLKFIYFRDTEEPNKDFGVAVGLLQLAQRYEVTSDMESVMRGILLSKPAEWFDADTALKFLEYSLLQECKQLKVKALNVLKRKVIDLHL